MTGVLLPRMIAAYVHLDRLQARSNWEILVNGRCNMKVLLISLALFCGVALISTPSVVIAASVPKPAANTGIGSAIDEAYNEGYAAGSEDESHSSNPYITGGEFLLALAWDLGYLVGEAEDP